MRPTATIHPEQLRACLFDFVNLQSSPAEVEIWANGDRFDIGNLEHLMWQFCGDENAPPWRYNGVSDYRTISRWTPKLRSMPTDLKFEPHDALEDNRKQIWRLWEHADAELIIAA
jgi:hypothetical protein